MHSSCRCHHTGTRWHTLSRACTRCCVYPIHPPPPLFSAHCSLMDHEVSLSVQTPFVHRLSPVTGPPRSPYLPFPAFPCVLFPCVLLPPHGPGGLPITSSKDTHNNFSRYRAKPGKQQKGKPASLTDTVPAAPRTEKEAPNGQSSVDLVPTRPPDAFPIPPCHQPANPPTRLCSLSPLRLLLILPQSTPRPTRAQRNTSEKTPALNHNNNPPPPFCS